MLLPSIIWLGAVSSAAQEPPDPAFGMPGAKLGLPDVSATMIGAMPRPFGRLRRVSWFHDGSIGSDEFPGWEKRATFDYDTSGRCVRSEEWMFGVRDALKRLETDPATGAERLVIWRNESWSATEYIANAAGLPIAIQLTPLQGTGHAESGEGGHIFTTFDRDSRGRVIRCWVPPNDRQLDWCAKEYWHDPAGRICVSRDRPGGGARICTRTFEYDDANRIRAYTYRFEVSSREKRWEFLPDIDGSLHRSEYTYDSLGNLVEVCETVDGHLASTSTLHYADDGKLAFCSTWTFASAGDPPVERASRTEEIFDGADRPLARRDWDANGRLVRSLRWTYETDARGNWTQKIPHEHSGGSSDVVVRRVIEYED